MSVSTYDDDPLSSEIDESDLATDVQLDSSVTWGTDWTVDTLIGQLQRGRFDLEPAFQRRDVWTDVRRSRFIESLLLGIPVPQIILAEHKSARGKFIVLDGKQRLRSLQRFAGLDGPAMKLKGLEVLRNLNGFTFKQIQERPEFEGHAAALENQVVRAVVLRDWTNEALLYLTFLRLNSNVTGLSPQELRRALHPGPFMDFAMGYSAESSGIRLFLKLKRPDFRMRDAEILIRHVGLTLRIDEYAGNLRLFLDETCAYANNSWASLHTDVEKAADGLDAAILATHEIFSNNAFKRYSNRGYETRRNRAVLDIMSYYLQHDDVREVCVRDAAAVRLSFEKLCRENEEFSISLTATTKSVGAVTTRLKCWGEALAEISPSANRYIYNA